MHVRASILAFSVIFIQWIMDFIICNGLGIWMGMLTCRYFSMKVCYVTTSHVHVISLLCRRLYFPLYMFSMHCKVINLLLYTLYVLGISLERIIQDTFIEV